MTFFKKKTFKNKLTESIQNDELTLEDVLLHEDFHMTIRNDSNILYERILREEDGWIDDIFNYALLSKTPPKKYKEFNKINQINKNAATFLENCGKKFMQYFKNESNVSSNQNALMQPKDLNDKLKYYITEFMNKQAKKYENKLCAGSFQRFIENFLRNEALDAEKTIKELTPFLVENCRILAYQQLIMKLLSDYCDSIGDEDDKTYKDLLLTILKRAASAVNFIARQKESQQEESQQSVFNVTSTFNKKENIENKSQPLNLSKEPIPLPNVVFDKSEFIQDLNEDVHNKYLPKVDNNITYNDKEDAEIEAYLLLMSIRTAIFDQTEIVNYFRNQDSFEFIKYLFYCGTRSEVKSLVSLESFRILTIIFNGSGSLLIESWKSTEKEKQQIPFYKYFADEMVFDPSCLTYKMIHALPVFWNHRYNADTYKLSAEEKETNDVSDYYKDGKKHSIKREKGETALEILQPCLFCEPPVSSQLIYSCTDIFIQLSKERKKFTKKENLKPEESELAVHLDCIILDFYQHHFNFGKTLKDISFWLFIKKCFPLVPTNDYYYHNEKEKRRVVLNGFTVDFLLRMTSMRTNTFFQIVKVPITIIASKKKCFSANNLIFQYQDLTNFELLSENTIYNKPIHNDYLFDDDVSDSSINENEKQSEKKFNINCQPVVVDEFSKSYKSIKSQNGKKGKESKKISKSERPVSKNKKEEEKNKSSARNKYKGDDEDESSSEDKNESSSEDKKPKSKGTKKK